MAYQINIRRPPLACIDAVDGTVRRWRVEWHNRAAELRLHATHVAEIIGDLDHDTIENFRRGGLVEPMVAYYG